jgi:hypothetical protein
MSLPSNRVLKQWPQPTDIDYGSFDPYTVSLVEGAIRWRDLSLRRDHFLFIGRGSDAPGYGHYLSHTVHNGYEDITDYIDRSSVEWTAEGISYIEPSGHRVFVPKAMFTGGR